MTAAQVDVPLSIDSLRAARSAARLGRAIHYFESVDSTNSAAHHLAATFAAEGTVVIAETQTRGRGRLGRSWISPPLRNLYMSVVLRPPLSATAAPQLSLLAGLAAAETIREWTPRACLKWPNDVLIDGRKVCGILTELEAEGGRVAFVILGIGVNLNSTEDDFPAELHGKAVSLRSTTGAIVDRTAFTERLLSQLEARYDLFLREGFAAIHPLWEALSGLTGRYVRIDDGGTHYEGRVAGIAEDGSLRVRDAAGQAFQVMVGDVTVVDGYATGSQ
jgi:BirA family biotin operon repressor/biotin-[acetyl-CoA-carboxylase] ligase